MNGIFRGKFDENTSSFMSLRGSKYIQNIFLYDEKWECEYIERKR